MSARGPRELGFDLHDGVDVGIAELLAFQVVEVVVVVVDRHGSAHAGETRAGEHARAGAVTPQTRRGHLAAGLVVEGLVEVHARDLHELSHGERDVFALDHLVVGVVALLADVRLGVGGGGVGTGERGVSVQDADADLLDAHGEQVRVGLVRADAVRVREAVVRLRDAGAVQWEGGARRLGSRRFAVNLLVVDVRGHENVTRGGFHHQLVRGEVGAEGGVVDERLVVHELVRILKRETSGSVEGAGIASVDAVAFREWFFFVASAQRSEPRRARCYVEQGGCYVW